MMRHIMKVRGTKLKTKRLGQGWSQKQLAQIAGVHRATVIRAENGYGIWPEHAARLCAVLKLNLEEVMKPLKAGDAA